MAKTLFYIADDGDNVLGKVTGVLGDGNCFFRAVIRALIPNASQDQEEVYQSKLRQDACDLMEKYRTNFLEFFTGDSDDARAQAFERYIKDMRKDGFHADNYVQAAIARLLGRKIYLVQDSPSSGIFQSIFGTSDKLEFNTQLADNVEAEVDSSPLVLFYHRQTTFKSGHYDLIENANLEELKKVSVLKKMSSKKKDGLDKHNQDVLATVQQLEQDEKDAAELAKTTLPREDDSVNPSPASPKVSAPIPVVVDEVSPKSPKSIPVKSDVPTAKPVVELSLKILPVKLFEDTDALPVKFDVIDYDGSKAYKVPGETEINALYNDSHPSAEDEPVKSLSEQDVTVAKAKAAAVLIADLGFNVKLVGKQTEKWQNILAVWQDQGILTPEQIEKVLANHTAEEKTVLTAKMKAESGVSDAKPITKEEVLKAGELGLPESPHSPVPSYKEGSDVSVVAPAFAPVPPLVTASSLSKEDAFKAAKLGLPQSPRSQGSGHEASVESDSEESCSVSPSVRVLVSVPSERKIQIQESGAEVRPKPEGFAIRGEGGPVPSDRTMLLRQVAVERAREIGEPGKGLLKTRAQSAPPVVSSVDFVNARERAKQSLSERGHDTSGLDGSVYVKP